MEKILEEIFQNKLISSIIVIAISIILYGIFSRIVMKGQKSTKIKGKLDNRKTTYIRLLSSIIRYAFIIVTVLIVLQINGVNVSSMLAGVGILSVVIGLAVQDALKDIIMGANIITDNYFAVGDVIKYNGIEGKVIAFGLKTTRIQDIATGNIISITNRSITEAEKLSNKLYLNIPAPYEVPVSKIDKISNSIVEKIKEAEFVKDCKYLGLSDFKDSNLDYKLEIIYEPEYKYKVKRAALRAIKNELDKNNIEIPYTQIDIHNR